MGVQPLDVLPELRLSDLYEGPGDPRIDSELEAALAAARALGDTADTAFASVEAAGLHLAEVERIERTLARLSGYCAAATLLDVTDRDAVAMSGLVAARTAEIRSCLVPLGERWRAETDPAAEALLRAPELHRWRRWLRRERLPLPDGLHPRARHAITEVHDAAMTALGQARNRIVAQLPVWLEVGVDASLGEAQSRLYDPDPERRRRAEESIGEALDRVSPLMEGLLEGVVRTRRATATAMGCADASALRNLDDDIESTLVERLMTTLAERRALARRHAKLRARLLGTEALRSADRLAPIDPSSTPWEWATAWEGVKRSVGRLAAGIDELADLALLEGRIHARPGREQRDGASALSVGDQHGARLVMPFRGTYDDVLVLAHELGHVLHLDLAAPGGPFAQEISPVIAETFALVFETCVFRDRLREGDERPRSRLHAHMHFLDRVMGNTFRQAAHTRFEELLHRGCEQGGATGGRARDWWIDAHTWVYGDALRLSPSFASNWAQIPHFVHVPFYCRIYALAQLSALEVLHAVEAGRLEPSALVAVMQAGANQAPAELLHRIGITTDQPDPWKGGIGIVAEVLDAGEALADEVFGPTGILADAPS